MRKYVSITKPVLFKINFEYTNGKQNVLLILHNHPIRTQYLLNTVISVFPNFHCKRSKATLNRPHLDFQVHFYIKFMI